MGRIPFYLRDKQEGNALLMEDEIYIPLNFMKEQIDEQLFFMMNVQFHDYYN